MPSPQSTESEWLTRKKRIDGRLESAGWRIVREREFDSSAPLRTYERCAIEEYATANGPADYALCVGGKILGIVEAKKLSLGPQNVLVQAERYAKGLLNKPFDYRGYGVPFLYSTNGEVTWHHDIRHELNRSRQVAGFHTPDALLELLSRDLDFACEKLRATPNDHPLIRPYQIEASEGIENAIAERKRQMLIAMATGTGKTFTLVNETYRLMKSGAAKRILFLVDRRALAAQAVKAFASFEAESNASDAKSANAALDIAKTIFYVIQSVVNPHLLTRSIPSVDARIGIDLGKLLVARIGVPRGGARQDRSFLTAVGPAANIACRLQQMADTNEIWVGDLVRMHAHPFRQKYFQQRTPFDWSWIYQGTRSTYEVWKYSSQWLSPYAKVQIGDSPLSRLLRR